MLRMHALAGLLASVALAAGTAGPALAEPQPATLSIEAVPSHYLGGWWEQQVAFSVTCDGFETQEVWVDLPGYSGDVLAAIAPVPAGTRCSVDVSYWPDAGDGAAWEDVQYSPGAELTLTDGDTLVSVVMPRIWVSEWPPEGDTWSEHEQIVTIDRVYLNGKGGIEVEGTSWCPDAAGILTGDLEGDLYAGVAWSALQYVGRKTALTAGYQSGIAHPCWIGSQAEHGPFAWQTRFPYPSGALQFVYSASGKFGSGSIHVEASSDAGTTLVTQSFAPAGWTSFEGEFVPYDADCPDPNGDGWCVAVHEWYGWDQADLKPIRIR